MADREIPARNKILKIPIEIKYIERE